MRGGHRVHIVNFADGCFLTVKFFAIPGRHAGLTKAIARHIRHIGFAENCIGAIGTAMQRFGARSRIRDLVEMGGKIVAGAVVEIVAARFAARIRRFCRCICTFRGGAAARRKKCNHQNRNTSASKAFWPFLLENARKMAFQAFFCC